MKYFVLIVLCSLNIQNVKANTVENTFDKQHIINVRGTTNVEHNLLSLSYLYQTPWAFHITAQVMRNTIIDGIVTALPADITRDGVAIGIAKHLQLHERWFLDFGVAYGYYYSEKLTDDSSDYMQNYVNEFLAEHEYGKNHHGLFLNAGLNLRLFKDSYMGLSIEASSAQAKNELGAGLSFGYKF